MLTKDISRNISSLPEIAGSVYSCNRRKQQSPEQKQQSLDVVPHVNRSFTGADTDIFINHLNGWETSSNGHISESLFFTVNIDRSGITQRMCHTFQYIEQRSWIVAVQYSNSSLLPNACNT